MKLAALTIVPVLALSSGANADVSISNKPTKNMSCVSGVCTPTAKKAVLNVTDLASMLAAGNVTVMSDGLAMDIRFVAPLSWTATSRLTLDSYRSIVFQQPISVTGEGALTIKTNDGGSGGDFVFEKKGHVEFWDLNSALVINANRYKLVKSLSQLANVIQNKPSGWYALARDYNASKDGTYSASPVQTEFDVDLRASAILFLAFPFTTRAAVMTAFSSCLVAPASSGTSRSCARISIRFPPNMRVGLSLTATVLCRM